MENLITGRRFMSLYEKTFLHTSFCFNRESLFNIPWRFNKFLDDSHLTGLCTKGSLGLKYMCHWSTKILSYVQSNTSHFVLRNLDSTHRRFNWYKVFSYDDIWTTLYLLLDPVFFKTISWNFSFSYHPECTFLGAPDSFLTHYQRR